MHFVFITHFLHNSQQQQQKIDWTFLFRNESENHLKFFEVNNRCYHYCPDIFSVYKFMIQTS